MEKIWHITVYTEHCVTLEEHFVLLTESPLIPKLNRETLAQISFDVVSNPAKHAAIQAVFTWCQLM